MRRLVLAALLGVLSVPGAGCGADDSGTGSSGPDQTRRLEVPEAAPASKGALTAEPAAGDFQGIDFDSYDASVTEILSLLDEYWATALPERFGTEYSPPDKVIAYYPDDGAPKCAGEPLGPENAYYCGANNTIAWDEPGLMVPFYEEVGDAAVGFVLAHEWGHLIQNQVEGEDAEYTIEEELQADCLAGDFARALFDEGLLEGGTDLEPGTDLAEAAEGIFLFGDAPATPWQDPDAHGSGKQRLRAFEIGFDGRAEACAEKLGPGFTKRI